MNEQERTQEEEEALKESARLADERDKEGAAKQEDELRDYLRQEIDDMHD